MKNTAFKLNKFENVASVNHYETIYGLGVCQIVESEEADIFYNYESTTYSDFSRSKY